MFPESSMSFELININLFSICIPLLFVFLIVGYLILKREVKLKTRNLEIEIEIRKQAEVALREAETNYRLMVESQNNIEESLHEKKVFLDNISDLAYIADMEGNLTYVNSAAERIIGLGSSEIISQPFVPLFMEKDRQSLIDVYDRTLAGESLENTLTFMNGVTCHFTSLPFTSSAGKVVGTFGIGRDITETLKTQKAFQESEARLKKAQSIAKIGNWEYDIATGEVWGSEEAFVIYGIERTSPTLPLDRVEACTPDAPKVNKPLVDLVQKNKKYDIEFEVFKENSGEKIFIHSVAELIIENGIPKKVLGVIQDITEQKKAEKEKELLRKQLRQSQKMESIGTLAGGIAHDFNNILVPVLGYTEMMIEDIDDNDPLRASLNEVLSGTMRAKDLVKQILTFSRQAEKERKPFKFHIIIKEVLNLSRAMLPSTIVIEQDVHDDCGMVMGDPTQIHQVAMNLITNAFQAMEEDGGTLSVQLKAVDITPENIPSAELSPGPYVCLTVQDTGAGIDVANLEMIFNPYFTTKETDKGTGLGLAIVYGIIQSHKGGITVQSEPGQGALFNVYFPRIAHDMDSKNERKPVDMNTGNERILLVDDEVVILEMVSKMLKRFGYGITTFNSSTEALEAFRSDPDNFEMVITDMTMPNLTGDRLIIELKKIRPGIPVILCTGFSDRIPDAIISSIGIDRILVKPITREELAGAIRDIFDTLVKSKISMATKKAPPIA